MIIDCLVCQSSHKENTTFAAKIFENVIHSFENMFSKFFENPLRICLEGGKIPNNYSKPNLVNWENNQTS